jgi:hypothetical protein
MVRKILLRSNLKLSVHERERLDQIRARLSEQGVNVSDEKFITALLRAASQLPEEELLRLISEGLQGVKTDQAPKRK